MLHVNEYSKDKVLIHAIISLSETLERDGFPSGLHDQWPPASPAGSLMALTDIDPAVPLISTAPSLEPRDRYNPAASSMT